MTLTIGNKNKTHAVSMRVQKFIGEADKVTIFFKYKENVEEVKKILIEDDFQVSESSLDLSLNVEISKFKIE